MPKLEKSKNFPMDNVYKRYTKHVLQKKFKKIVLIIRKLLILAREVVEEKY